MDYSAPHYGRCSAINSFLTGVPRPAGKFGPRPEINTGERGTSWFILKSKSGGEVAPACSPSTRLVRGVGPAAPAAARLRPCLHRDRPSPVAASPVRASRPDDRARPTRTPGDGEAGERDEGGRPWSVPRRPPQHAASASRLPACSTGNSARAAMPS
ncbi:hypothetical protein A33M_2469 [Rhodovulum sp. PH10]|nr:hypothetical protein A33M_2469 [Rhodovulum sp. PH10]